MKLKPIRRAGPPMIEVATDEASIEEASRPPPQPEVELESDADDKEPEDKKEKRHVPRETKAMAELRNNTDNALKEWMEGLSPNGGVKVRVTRTSPKVWKGLNVGGSLATYDHYIDEDWIREHHGGGNFMLEVKKPRTNGSGWVIAGSRAIAIAGDPRTDDVFRDSPAGVPAVAPNTAGSDMLVKAAFSSMERQIERAQSQPPPQNHGPDLATMQMLLAPLQSQIDQMGTMLREKDRELAEARRAPVPEVDPIKDKMFSALIDGDSARVVSMRTQHESELRQIKQSAIDSEARLRDSFDRDRQSINMAHEREMNTLRSSYDMKIASVETMNSTIKTLLEGEIRRLEAALTEARTELVTLRAKKDKTIIEQATEFAAIKEAIGDITGGDEKEKSTLEKVMEVAGNLPAVQGLIGKLGEAQAPPPPPPPQPQLRARPQLLTGPDGNLYRQLPNGDMVMVRERKKPAAPTEPGQPVIPEIAPATIAAAVGFLESAFRGGQDPGEVATSVRSMVPADVISAIRTLGIDGFLTNVAKLDSMSPLATQGGRNWTRKLGKSLLEG